MTGALQPDELGDIFEVLAKDVLLAPGHHGHVAHAEGEQPFPSPGIVQDVHGFEVDAFARKKLFRPETGASAGLGEKYEFVCDATHDDHPVER
jgi:hypothetical protein